jgi:hypothetical protein
VQLWVGLVAVWALCRSLRVRAWVGAVSVVTWALCAATLDFFRDFWPDQLVMWTLLPLLLLLLFALLDSDGRRRRALFSVGAGLCAGFMLLNGHAGVFPAYALGVVAFLLGRWRRVRELWPWLVLGLAVFALVAATKVYDIALESARTSGSHRPQQVYGIDFPRLLFYPFHLDANYRTIAIGGPFVLLTLVGLAWRGVSHRHVNGLRAAVAVSFLAWFFPSRSVSVLTGNWYFGQTFTLFAILLAGLTLHALWERFPRARRLLLAAAGLQVAVLVWGFVPLYHSDARRAADYLDGKTVPSLKNTFENQPIYRSFEARPDHGATRVYMAPLARDRLWRSLTDYEWIAWSFHGLRLLNGHFRGIDVHELQRQKETLHGEIRGEPDIWKGKADDLPTARGVLDVLDVGYVLATPGERVASSLVPIQRFRLADGSMIEAYRNPAAWPDAVVLAQAARSLGPLRQRPGCDISGLLCDDLAPVEALRRAGAMQAEWHGVNLSVRFPASAQPGVLLVSQMYRPGWRARLSDGRTVNGYRLVGALTGFDLPPGVSSAEVFFHPTGRIVFATLSWAALFLALVFVAAVGVRVRRRGA